MFFFVWGTKAVAEPVRWSPLTAPGVVLMAAVLMAVARAAIVAVGSMLWW